MTMNLRMSRIAFGVVCGLGAGLLAEGEVTIRTRSVDIELVGAVELPGIPVAGGHQRRTQVQGRSLHGHGSPPGCESGKRTARKVAGNVLEAASARNSLKILAAGFL